MLLHDARATFFHCRWPDDVPIPVSLPPAATADERRALEAALDAWQAALGVRFSRAPARPAAIEIDFVDGAVATGAGQDTANTVVDCRVASLATPEGAALDAARIRLARTTNADWQGHQRPLSPAELTGAALHELGHALGFQGHARHGDSVMVREVERIARAGKKLLAGEGFRDASVRALYAIPSGAVVGVAPVARCRTDLVDRMAALAEANALDGPLVRVGESAARIFWRDPVGVEYGLVVGRLAEGLRDPARLVVVPEPRVRQSLAVAKDVRCP